MLLEFSFEMLMSTFLFLQATVLERLESLPFDGVLDWEAGLALWRYYNERIYRRQRTGLCRESKETSSGNPELDPTAGMESGRETGLCDADLLPSELVAGSSDSPALEQWTIYHYYVMGGKSSLYYKWKFTGKHHVFVFSCY